MRANSLIGEREEEQSDLDTKLFYKLTEKARSSFCTKQPLNRREPVPDTVKESQQSARIAASSVTHPFKEDDMDYTSSQDTTAPSQSRTATVDMPPPSAKRVRFAPDDALVRAVAAATAEQDNGDVLVEEADI